MTDPPDGRHEAARLRRELSSALERLAQAAEHSRALEAELAETNKGVVALYAELDDKADQLRQASELKSRFLAYMSHEFRTPLGSIRSLAGMLLDECDGPLNVEQRRQMEFISAAAAELSELVDDLLDLAKIEAGRIRIAPVWFEMVDLFATLRGMFRPILQRAVDLVFEDPEIEVIYTDRERLSQILRNFISNALKFTQRGEVRVSARRTDGDHVRLTVTDTGIGIAPEHLAILFTDFSQVESAIQKKHRGTGLGLSLSKKIATLLGGSVHAQSTPGVGSSFSVVIPTRMEMGQGDAVTRA